VDEKKNAAASYIMTFYQEVQAVKQTYAAYLDLILDLQLSYGVEGISKLEDDQKDTVKSAIKQLRYLVIQSMTSYKAITQSTKKDINKKLQQSYDNIKKDYIIKIKDIELFTEELNRALLDQVITNLLKTSEDIISDIYKDG